MSRRNRRTISGTGTVYFEGGTHFLGEVKGFDIKILTLDEINSPNFGLRDDILDADLIEEKE